MKYFGIKKVGGNLISLLKNCGYKLTIEKALFVNQYGESFYMSERNYTVWYYDKKKKKKHSCILGDFCLIKFDEDELFSEIFKSEKSLDRWIEEQK